MALNAKHYVLLHLHHQQANPSDSLDTLDKLI